MPENPDNLVEVDRNKLMSMGGSVYILLPKFFRRDITPGVTADKYEAVFFHRPDSDETVIKIRRIET